MSVFVGLAVVGDADGFDEVGRALVGMAVIHWVGLYVAEGILVGFDVFVGAGVVGIKVCTLVGAAVGPMVFGKQSLSIIMLILTLSWR